jgi:hypothetical protein
MTVSATKVACLDAALHNERPYVIALSLTTDEIVMFFPFGKVGGAYGK